MTIMPVEPVNMTASYGGWETALGLLREHAAELGLELIGWGAVPADPPEITINGAAFICPHCGVESEDLGVMFASDAQPYASPEGVSWEVSEPVDGLLVNAAQIAYVCSNCNGFVKPTDDVVVI